MTYEKLSSLGINIDRGLLAKDNAFPETGLAGDNGVNKTKQPTLLNGYRWRKGRLRTMGVQEPTRRKRNNWERKLG